MRQQALPRSSSLTNQQGLRPHWSNTMTDYRYLQETKEVKAQIRNDKIATFVVSVLGALIGAACIIFSIDVLLG